MCGCRTPAISPPSAAVLDDIEHVAPRDTVASEPVCLVERLEEGSIRICDARLL
jgi:hypothetical protein